MNKTLLAAAILGLSGAALASELTLTPVVYAPYGVVPVTVSTDQVKATVEAYNRQLVAAHEESRRAYEGTTAKQRRVSGEFQRFHDEQVKAANAMYSDSVALTRQLSEDMEQDMTRMGDDLRAKVLGGNRDEVKAYIDARFEELAQQHSARDQEVEAARRALDARFEAARRSPLEPLVPAGHLPL
jgi:hypothetical protein